MTINKNLETILSTIEVASNIPKNIQNLIKYCKASKVSQKSSKNPQIYFSKDTNSYVFKHDNKDYKFELFTDRKIQEIDKKIVKEENTSDSDKVIVFRTLKLACSMDLINPKVIVGSSSTDKLAFLISYEEDGTKKVVDYKNNLIMKQDEFYKLFDFKEINTLDRYEIYNLYNIMDKLGDYKHLYEYLIFSKEITSEISKRSEFSYLREKYDSIGYNNHNYFLFADKTDYIFHLPIDSNHKYKNTIINLDYFTMDPNLNSKYVSYDKKTRTYVYKDHTFGKIRFSLLSDVIDDEKIKKELRSNQRYSECHINNLNTSLLFGVNDDVFITSGKIEANEVDYYNHTWVEIESENLVADYNHNIIMNRDIYYKLFGAKKISKTSTAEMEDVIKTVIIGTGIYFHPIYIDYLGKEMKNDLMKNQKILKKEISN